MISQKVFSSTYIKLFNESSSAEKLSLKGKSTKWDICLMKKIYYALVGTSERPVGTSERPVVTEILNELCLIRN